MEEGARYFAERIHKGTPVRAIVFLLTMNETHTNCHCFGKEFLACI